MFHQPRECVVDEVRDARYEGWVRNRSARTSVVVIRFANPKGIDFPYLLSMLDKSFMSRPNTIVCPGGKMGLAMQLIFTPMILRLVDLARRKRAEGAHHA